MRSRMLILFALASLPLAGCDSLSRALGLEKVVPDEFQVVSRAPLAVPPDYALRPPKPGAAPTQEVTATEQARQSIFRAGDQQAGLPPGAEKRSTGENELLRAAGAGSAPPNIRETIARETNADPVDQSFVDKLLFWRSADSGTGQVINPQAESDRLKGKTPSGMTGTPRIERSKLPSMTAVF
jgi:Protein of unknown function (DUF3035)